MTRLESLGWNRCLSLAFLTCSSITLTNSSFPALSAPVHTTEKSCRSSWRRRTRCKLPDSDLLSMDDVIKLKGQQVRCQENLKNKKRWRLIQMIYQWPTRSKPWMLRSKRSLSNHNPSGMYPRSLTNRNWLMPSEKKRMKETWEESQQSRFRKRLIRSHQDVQRRLMQKLWESWPQET